MKEHEWVEPNPNNLVEWTYCRRCGIVRRADGLNRDCRGEVRIEVREQDKG